MNRGIETLCKRCKICQRKGFAYVKLLKSDMLKDKSE